MADRWRTRPEKPDRVKVTKPDPETGEVVEMTRADSTVKANARKARRADAPPNLLQITARERRDLIAGRTTRLIRKTRLAEVDAIVEEKGEYVYILSWDQSKSFVDPETRTKLTPDAHPACWVTVSGKPAIAKGKGYAYDLKVEHHNRDRPDPLLKTKAGYTRDRSQALDPDAPPVLAPADVAKIDAEARLAAAKRREQDAETRRLAARRQERVLREQVREAMSRLSPTAQQELLARLERDIREAVEQEAA